MVDDSWLMIHGSRRGDPTVEAKYVSSSAAGFTDRAKKLGTTPDSKNARKEPRSPNSSLLPEASSYQLPFPLEPTSPTFCPTATKRKTPISPDKRLKKKRFTPPKRSACTCPSH
eukprot:scaffold3068_cov269-Pinguiococcus_pyrenoidosus.AAC.10